MSCPDPLELTADCVVDADVTVTLRGLTFHPHDPPFVLLDFNPFGRTVRAESETARAWADGAWSGAEWAEAATIPLTVLVKPPDLAGSVGTRFFWGYYQQLAQAFAPSHIDVPLEFTIANPDRPTGVDSFVVFGRPRLVEAQTGTALRGWALVRGGFRVLDPLLYSGGPAGQRAAQVSLPQAVGGLSAPLQVPLCVDATVVAGRVTVAACGTVATGLTLTMWGPATDPRVTLSVEGQPTQTLSYHGALADGQFLVLDTRGRTALLNGTVSRRGLVSGDWLLLPPGTSELGYHAADYDPDAHLEIAWRDAWTV
jgi:hypothetical protein